MCRKKEFMNIFVSGLWPTSDGNGLQAMMRDGDKYLLYTDDIFSVAKNLFSVRLIGHSFGGQACIDACSKLWALGKDVDDLILLDPVPYWWWVFGKFKIPPNVKNAICYKKSFGLPPSCGIVTPGFQTITIDTWDHAGFPKEAEVTEAVMERLGYVTSG